MIENYDILGNETFRALYDREKAKALAKHCEENPWPKLRAHNAGSCAMTPDQIRALRDGLGYSTAEFAKRLGVSDRSIDYWLAGVKRPSRLALKALRRLEAKAKVKP
jgi:DNA-binding transcriptional regulator YiaG